MRLLSRSFEFLNGWRLVVMLSTPGSIMGQATQRQARALSEQDHTQIVK